MKNDDPGRSESIKMIMVNTVLVDGKDELLECVFMACLCVLLYKGRVGEPS